MHPIARNRGKEPFIPNDVDTPTDDELSSGSSSSLSLSPVKNARESTKAKSHKRPSHHLAFSDVVSGASQGKERGKQEAEPTKSCPWERINIARRYDATIIAHRYDATNIASRYDATNAAYTSWR